MKKNTLYATLAFSALLPSISFAALDGVVDLICSFSRIINIVIPVIFGLALIFFFWGLAQFILHSGEEKAHEEGKNKMLWGIVALFVMFSISGILNWVAGTVGIDPSAGGARITSQCPASAYDAPPLRDAPIQIGR